MIILIRNIDFQLFLNKKQRLVHINFTDFGRRLIEIVFATFHDVENRIQAHAVIKIVVTEISDAYSERVPLKTSAHSCKTGGPHQQEHRNPFQPPTGRNDLFLS